MQPRFHARVSIPSASAFVASAALAALAAEAFAGGSACYTGSVVRVCVEWTQGGNPVHGTHFNVTEADTSNPDLEFTEGDDWTVYAELVSNGALANLGDVTTTDSENYTVKISRGGTTGAVNVASLVFQPSGNNHAAIVSASRIGGNLTGDLDLKSYNGAGGTANGLTIEGNVLGDITLRDGKGLTVGGTFGTNSCSLWSNCPVLTAEKVDGGTLKIYQLKKCEIYVTDAITASGGIFEVETTVQDGTQVFASLANQGKIVVGSALSPGTSASIGTWNIAGDEDDTEIDMSRVNVTSSGGVVYWDGGANFTDVNGTVKFYGLHGVFGADQLTGTGVIDIATDLGGVMLFFGAGSAGGEVLIGDDLDGSIQFLGSMGSTIQVGDDLIGVLNFDSDLSGLVDIDGDVTGDILVADDLVNGGVIDIGVSMGSGGEISIADRLEGDIYVGLYTADGSSIEANGLASGGSVLINTLLDDAGYADGDFAIGYSSPPSAVAYDGAFHVLNGPESGGTFGGTAVISGCHFNSVDLDFFACGGIVGTVTITQGGCVNQVELTDTGFCQ